MDISYTDHRQIETAEMAKCTRNKHAPQVASNSRGSPERRKAQPILAHFSKCQVPCLLVGPQSAVRRESKKNRNTHTNTPEKTKIKEGAKNPPTATKAATKRPCCALLCSLL